MNKYIEEQRNEIATYLVNKIREEGQLPWTNGLKIDFSQHNPISGTRYKGANILRLYVSSLQHEFTDPRWVTMAQLNDLNKKEGRTEENRYKVRKGSKGTKVEFWDIIKKDSKRYEEYTKNWSQERKEQQKGDIVIGKAYTVFNASQIENFPELVKEPDLTQDEQSKELETIIANSEAPISYDGSGQNFYNFKEDSIHLTNREAFENSQQFYSTALHEIAHSTGHETRLNRDLTGEFGYKKYAIEELNAEFASAFLNNRYDIGRSQAQLDNHAAYLQSWAQEIENDPNVLFKSIQNAEKIVDYIEKNMLYKELEQTQALTNTTETALGNSKGSITGRVEWIEGTNFYPPDSHVKDQSHIFLGGSDHAFSYNSPSKQILKAMADDDVNKLYVLNKDVLQANEYLTMKEYTGKELNQLCNDIFLDDTINGVNSYGYDKCKLVITVTDETGQKMEFPLRMDIGDGNNFKLTDAKPLPLQNIIESVREDFGELSQPMQNTLQAYSDMLDEKVKTKEYELPSFDSKNKFLYQLAKLNVVTDLNNTPNWESYPKESLKDIFKGLASDVPITEILDRAEIQGIHSNDVDRNGYGYNRLEEAIVQSNRSVISRVESNDAQLLTQSAAANLLDVYQDKEMSSSFKSQLQQAAATIAQSNYEYKEARLQGLSNLKRIMDNTAHQKLEREKQQQPKVEKPKSILSISKPKEKGGLER